MHAHADDGDDGEELVNVEEGFVEGVADYRSRLDDDEAQGYGCEKAVL